MTLKAAFSALLATNIVFFPTSLTFPPWNGDLYLQFPSFSYDRSWLFQEQKQSSSIALVLNECCPLRKHSHSFAPSVAHWCIVSGFWFASLPPLPFLPSWSSTLRAEQYVRLEASACWKRNMGMYFFRKKKVYLLLALYLVKNCFPHISVKLHFQFLAVKGNVWPKLGMYQSWNQLGGVMTPFGIRSGSEPQWNQYVTSFLLRRQKKKKT